MTNPTQIQSTMDYSRFKLMLGNRRINQLHLARLKKAMQEQYLFDPIKVNQKMEIVDGQHRFFSAQSLGLPIHYIVIKGYGLREVQKLNAINNNWKGDNFLQTYVDTGLTPYIQMKKFMEDFPDFGIKSTIKIITNGSDDEGNSQKVNAHRRDFQEGRLKIHNLKLAYENARKIMEYKVVFEGFSHLRFVSTMISLFKIKGFDNEELLHKIKISPFKLIPCHTIEQYKDLLEKIYNYKRRDKVNLRF